MAVFCHVESNSESRIRNIERKVRLCSLVDVENKLNEFTHIQEVVSLGISLQDDEVCYELIHLRLSREWPVLFCRVL